MTVGQWIIRTWTPSRFALWKECPAHVRYKDLMKMCPVCFKGRVSGGYDGEPVVCDTCFDPQPERAAMDRGNLLDAALTAHGTGKVILPTGMEPGEQFDRAVVQKMEEHEASLDEALRHPKIEALVKKLKRTKNVDYQASYVLNAKWEKISQFTKNAWARLKLDVLVLGAKVAEVIDWKSGNIDKSKGEIREKAEYHDSMRAYQLVVLAVHPKVQEVRARMAFLDAPPKLEKPFKEMLPLKRAWLEDAKKDWLRKIEPMMNDTILAPRPGYYCTWCPFSKDKGGPCPHSGQRR